MIVRRFASLKWPPAAAVVFCGVLGTLLPAAYGKAAGVRVPQVHDEFSYLLGADTFLHGRLTNPTPKLAEFFEAPHILVEPTYASKFPPGQSIALAFGQVALRHPIWGVWFGCGLYAAALCWMLQAWTTKPWALAVSVATIVTLGVSTYWAQSVLGRHAGSRRQRPGVRRNQAHMANAAGCTERADRPRRGDPGEHAYV